MSNFYLLPHSSTLCIDFPNPSIAHSPIKFPHGLSKDQILHDSDEIDIPDTNLFPDFVIQETLQELDVSFLESGNTQTDDTPTFRVITNSSQN